MKENKKNIITIVVAVTLLLVFVIGLTYALFTFTGRGQRINQVTTTSVTMSYSEAVNGITLTNAMPISDAAGIVLNDSNQTFEFTVSVVTGSATPVAWEVSAEKLEGSTLTNTDVKIYLEKKLSTDVNYTAVSSPSNFVPEASASVIGTPSGQMILDQDSTTSSVTYNYILRMWVSESYELDETERSFSVKINVYGKDNYKSATGISLNKNSTTIVVGNNETLTTTITPNDAYNDTVTWSSSNPNVATVSSSGVVTGISVGSAVITARTKNGKIATCNVTVILIPDGSTVTPVNDVATWLKCAGIRDKSYTTISQVLSDTTTLSTLINDDNANDYLVRSTSWTSNISGNQTAMNYIGQNNYSANTLLDNSTWRTAICDSTYFESILNVKVPIMTSNTSPYGEAFSSTYYTANYEAFRAFDGVYSTFWLPTMSHSDDYIGYTFTQSKNIFKVKMKMYNQSQNLQPIMAKIQASVNNQWTDISENKTLTLTPEDYEFDCDSTIKSTSFRLLVTGIMTQAGGVAFQIRELQFYGREDI